MRPCAFCVKESCIEMGIGRGVGVAVAVGVGVGVLVAVGVAVGVAQGVGVFVGNTRALGEIGPEIGTYCIAKLPL